MAMAVIGLLLAAIGLNGVLWYSVTQRRREIGIRAALGATPSGVAFAIARRGVLATVIGLAVGGAGAVLAGRVVEARLFGVDALDPMAYGLGALLIAAAAAVAAWTPARQASRVPPREILNAE